MLHDRRPWNFSKVLFVYIRYAALARHMYVRLSILLCSLFQHLFSPLLFIGNEFGSSFHYSDFACHAFFVYQQVILHLLIISLDIILIMRGTVILLCVYEFD